MKLSDWLRLLTLSLLWGGSFLFYRMLATELPPATTVLSRVMIGAAALLLFLRFKAQKITVPRAAWPGLFGLALLNNVVPFGLFAWAAGRVTGGVESVLNALTPMFVVLVSGLVLRNEALTARKLAGVGLGLAGVAVMVGPDALLGADLSGQIACLLAALCYGFALPLGRRITGIKPDVMALAQLSCSSLMLVVPVLLIDQPWQLPGLTTEGWVAVAGLGLLSTGMAYLLFFSVLASAGATNLSLVTLLVPVSALLLGRVVLHEPIGLRAVFGMALIAAGLAAIDGRLFNRRRSA